MIPALKNAEFLRYGIMHKNHYINSPEVLNKDLSLKACPYTFIAGQLSGVEGYVESIAGGLICAINLVRKLEGKEYLPLTNNTVLGALTNYVTTQSGNFQPMNANYGIISPLEEKIRDKALKKELMGKRALEEIKDYKEKIV